MLDRTGTQFSHVKPADTDYVSGGLRDFFLYRDLGIAEAWSRPTRHRMRARVGTGMRRTSRS
jgi:hypothetical protein